MLTIEGNAKEPQLWVGASLRHFGLNPYGEPLFRVVLASTRSMLVGGKHTVRNGAIPTDREIAANGGRDYSITQEWVGYKYYPRYPSCKGYVLEAWMSPVQYGGTPQQWELQQRDEETGLSVLGPYPTRGEYDFKWDFGVGYPTVTAVESVIRMIMLSGNYSFAEKRSLMIAADEKEQKIQVDRAKEEILDALPAHGFNKSDRFPGKKTPEDYQLRYSANDLGLPTGNNKVFTRRSNNAS